MSATQTRSRTVPADVSPGEGLRVLISGGGSGGHVFPAIAIADAVKEALPNTRFLFVGAQDKIEMEKVPLAGYPIQGLWISGFHRQLTMRNLLFPVKLVHSLLRAWGILRRFAPDVVVGVGGFASGPVLEVAVRRGVPTLIQEQNSYPGITNKLLARRVARICVAYPGMEKYFPAEKLVLTGNPVRNDLHRTGISRAEAARHFGLDPNRKTILVFGGSLGAQSLNAAMEAHAPAWQAREDVQIIWQAGKLYVDRYRPGKTAALPRVRLLEFIDHMDLAYALADLIVCRAGALTISELCLVGKAALLVPSPNVAEDHQTMNARALVEADAAVLLRDDRLEDDLSQVALHLLDDPEQRKALGDHIRRLARPDAASSIADEVIRLAQNHSQP